MNHLVFHAVYDEGTYGPVLVREDDMTMYVDMGGSPFPVVQYGPILIPCFPMIVVGILTHGSDLPEEQFRAFTCSLRRVVRHMSSRSKGVIATLDTENEDDIAEGRPPRFATEGDARAAEQRDRENYAAADPPVSVLHVWDSFGGTVPVPTHTTFQGRQLPPNYSVAKLRAAFAQGLTMHERSSLILGEKDDPAPAPPSRARVKPSKPKRGKGKPRRRRR
ncbi:hypothetical protein KIPB_009923 [Kipferlia bialata]|uniref:Uncharacterized protein n=1 Tax=Kipferlia bialata TaxID=797122 RepID=A0A391NP72_9EUKA|nr:hypothetical protein KIPB_009923 [Kipferlia bialata]|eukprot:g9923.t1